MNLVDQVVEAVVDTAIAGRSRIVACAIKGVSCEGWLKVELLSRLLRLLDPDAAEITPELNDVDLVIRTSSDEVFLELKTFPTNYGRTGKPITNFIDGVVKDLAKLGIKRAPSGTGLAVWIAYGVPDPTPPTWRSHLAKVEAGAAATLRAERIPLWEKMFANLYVMRSK